LHVIVQGIGIQKRGGDNPREDKKRLNVNFDYGGGEEVMR
jgi:hypothetical protein